MDTNNNALDKAYSLRPRCARRDEQECHQESWKPRGRRKKCKKSLPLSKYRRKTANARERFRMREINEAFEALRRAVPDLTTRCDSPCEKLTKISTLRLAMKYIKALSNALQDDVDSDAESFLSDWTFTPGSSTVEQPDCEHFFSSSSSESAPTLASADFSNPPCQDTTFFLPDPYILDQLDELSSNSVDLGEYLIT